MIPGFNKLVMLLCIKKDKNGTVCTLQTQFKFKLYSFANMNSTALHDSRLGIIPRNLCFLRLVGNLRNILYQLAANQLRIR